MAYKNPYRLSGRRQGEIIGQVYKLIVCHSDFFVPRNRVYLKDVAKVENSIYWLENPKTSEITALTLVEPKYQMDLNDVKLVVIGHTLSKIRNQMHNILDHLFSDYLDQSMVFFLRESFGVALMLEQKYSFVRINSEELNHLWPEMALTETDYFNLPSGEYISQGLARKQYYVYLRLTEVDKQKFVESHASLLDFISSSTVVVEEGSDEGGVGIAKTVKVISGYESNSN